MLWTMLHDVRLFLLRVAHGEPLNADCGGGSLASNLTFLFYHLRVARAHANPAATHASALGAALSRN